MASIISPLIRQPCGGDVIANKLFLGGCFNQANSSGSGVKVVHNLTKVRNYDTSSDTQSIDPYPVPNQGNAGTTVDCSPYDPESGGAGGHGYVCGNYGVSNVNAPCWPLDPADYRACGAGTSSMQILDYHNCFAESNDTTSLTSCTNLGFKNCYAQKSWNGIKGKMSLDLDGRTTTVLYCCDGNCIYLAYNPTVDTTKYLAMAATVANSEVDHKFIVTCVPAGSYECPDGMGGFFPVDNTCCSVEDGGTTTRTSNAENATHIDIFGNLFIDSFSSSSTGYTDPDSGGFAAEQAFGEIGGGKSDINSMGQAFCAETVSTMTAFGNPTTVAGDGNSWHLEWHIPLVCLDGCGNVTSTTDELAVLIDFNMSAGTMDIYTYGPQLVRSGCTSDGYCPGWIQTGHTSYRVGNLSIIITTDGFGQSASDDFSSHQQIVGNLATAYTAKQAYDQAVALLAMFPVDDVSMYPWRTDMNVTIGPLMSYDEGDRIIPDLGVIVPNIRFTGDVLGLPGPRGIDRMWSPYHKNICICDDIALDDCFGTPIQYVKDVGAWSTDIGVPCATQWYDNLQASNTPQGAFIMMNQDFSVPAFCNSNGGAQGFNDVVRIGEYWEVVFKKQSYNLARPCEIDRFLPTHDSGRCVSAYESSSHQLSLDMSGDPTDITNGQYVIVCGVTGSVDGIWKATVVDGYTIIVHDQVMSSSDYPQSVLENCGADYLSAGIIAKIKYQPPLSPAICGRLVVTDATPTAPVTVSLSDPSWLVNGDQVTIVSANGGNINGNWTVTVQDNQTIFLNGSDGTTGAPYTGSTGQIFSVGAPDWKWNSVLSLGQYSVITWSYNFRDVGEYNRMAGQKLFLESQTQCDNVTQCFSPALPPDPRISQSVLCFLDQGINSISCSTHCLPFSSCAPSVAGFSPVNRNFGASSKNHGFGTFTGDSIYGSKWQGMIKQAMDDPLFEKPPCPCQDDVDFTQFDCNFQWLEAPITFTCIPDDNFDQPPIRYFANVATFETMCQLPLGAPALPPGAYIGCVPITAFTSSTDCPAGIICYPPFFDANSVLFQVPDGGCAPAVFPWTLPWQQYLSKLACVCANQRFSASYIANGIICLTS